MWFFNILLLTLVFFSGASIASFWLVVIYRQKKRISWIKGRSFCDQCQKKISWYDDIPVVSYLILKGHCRYCQRKIPSNYFWGEIFFGCWWVIWFYLSMKGNFLNFATWSWLALWSEILLLLVGMILLWTALVDFETQEITNAWLVILSVLTLMKVLISFLNQKIEIISLSKQFLLVICFIFGYYLLNQISLWIWRKKGLGSGDLWMFIILLWWLSLRQLLVMFLLSFWLGALVGVLMLLKNKKKQTLAFLPFINLAFILAYYFGEQIFAYWF